MSHWLGAYADAFRLVHESVAYSSLHRTRDDWLRQPARAVNSSVGPHENGRRESAPSLIWLQLSGRAREVLPLLGIIGASKPDRRGDGLICDDGRSS